MLVVFVICQTQTIKKSTSYKNGHRQGQTNGLKDQKLYLWSMLGQTDTINGQSVV